MARYKGIFKASANYEPQVAAPFDARMLVEAKSDLTTAATWQQTNGSIWTYVGMIVSVAADIDPANNGVYRLTAKDWSVEDNWQKLANSAEIEDLQKQIDNIEVGGGDLSVEIQTEADLPKIGATGTTYYVIENNSIYRWQAETQSYISFGGGEPELDIQIIHGGNANGTN